MMLQADERDPANSLLDYGYEDDPDDLDKFSVSFEGLMAFLDGDKDENPDEKKIENTNGFCQYSDNVNGENSAYIHSGLLKPSDPGAQWTSADYSQTYDSHGTGLGTLFAHETSENFSQPNTPEKFYSVHNASEKNFLKDDSCDLSEYYGQQSYGHETDHSFLYNSGAEIDGGKCCAALCEIGTDHMGEYSSCTNQELSGFFNSSSSPEVYTFDVQDNFNGCGSQENSAYKGNFFTSRGPLVDPDSVSSSVPNIVIGNFQTFDIKVESTKSYLTSKYSGGSRTGSLMETTSFLSLSDAMGENTGFSRSGRADQHCTSSALPNQITSLLVKQEKAVESSFPICSVDVDVSSPSSNYHLKSSVNMPFAESFSVPLTGSGDTVMNYQDFKNILQSTNSKTSLKDEFHVSRHSSSQERCSSASEVVQCNSSQVGQSISDDADVCVLEDISAPTVLSGPARVFHPRSHSFPKSDYHYSEEVPFWHKADDERLTFQMALQDLSEPKSEASPPSGVLAVPLLRHQRIALSWMMQKETSGLNCSGGILADDQGLGKTISTIALILSERTSLSNNCNHSVKPIEIETLNLEDDEEEVQFDCTNHHENSSINTKKMRKVAESGKDTASVKGRPSAGTLVVCPTSVLRQWAEELRSKVTSKGNLSFLVYHGSNRTKDPVELSKYDVVLTTYSIVTMEVPKQLGSDKDEEKVKSEVNGALPSNRKRKTLSSKSKADRTLIEEAARPLARVAWFRVILDEAQTIKNHRTQVAKACCGLRAKRRWCLSGTPIQNAIDDLYSYFRFLRYEPYALYNSFCSTIKIPINKNPTTGYKKLQAVLKTVMLRRTKGSLLDGQPIISLPPKSVTLKKVDFSVAERSFYQRLEAESCEQFKVYAAEGTVKQNYVNILLMLLRLRQACDHPLLVQEYDSGSPWKASVESAKKLPWGKQVELLNHLEASMAICTICSDPPEDAVVAICSHVFCNQCVCEHLMGDDKHCPAFNCKTKLDASLIFPKSSLSHSLSALKGSNAPSNPSNESTTNEPFKDLISSDSSKIKAAIEILQALPKLKDTQTVSSPDGKDELNSFSPTEIANETFPVSYDGMDSLQEKCSADVRTEKAIVFSQWTRMLDLLETRLKSSSIEYRRLDGTMSVAARDKAIKDFNTIPQVTVMIMSLKAASLGLNLVSACHVLLLDLWWNPTTEDQAIDRAHRIGQTRPVTVARLTVNNTVEDRILLLQEKKRKMVSSAFGEDETGSRQSRLTVDDLKYLFMFNS